MCCVSIIGKWNENCIVLIEKKPVFKVFHTSTLSILHLCTHFSLSILFSMWWSSWPLPHRRFKNVEDKFTSILTFLPLVLRKKQWINDEVHAKQKWHPFYFGEWKYEKYELFFRLKRQPFLYKFFILCIFAEHII